MICIHIKDRDPYFCLAAEEYFLKQFQENIFMLWQSENTAVVGKHQNLLAEINYPYVRENNIKLARRISGGGTVFHDAGNVNFVFIKNVASPAEISFRQFTSPVVDALAKLGITATSSGRNDLMIDGLKISGNAEHVFKNRVLHHGTLLFDSDLKNLGQAIKVIPGKYESKAVQSNRSPVANIASFLKNNWLVDEFMEFLMNVQLEKSGVEIYNLNEKDNKTIAELSAEKFSTNDWIFGYSPKYSFENKIEIKGKLLSIQLNVVKGIVQNAIVSGDFFSQKENNVLSAKLENTKHQFENIYTLLQLQQNEVKKEIIYAFF